MNFPSITEYIEAIMTSEDNLGELSYLQPVMDEAGQPVMSSGDYSVVFKMRDKRDGRFYALRCFHHSKEKTDMHYLIEEYYLNGRKKGIPLSQFFSRPADNSCHLIEDYLKEVESPYFISFRYIDNELFVDSSKTSETMFPVVLMDWVEGVTLIEYLQDNIEDKYALEMLTYRFSQLALWLIPQPFAHGDLQPNNILVREDGTLVLVDYDNMYVPSMQGQKARELMNSDFRHPAQTIDDFDEHIDDFSIVSILLSLKAVSINPSLFKKYASTSRLLLSENDYKDVGQSSILKEIFPSEDQILNNLVNVLYLSLNNKVVSPFLLNYVEIPHPNIEALMKNVTGVTKEEIYAAYDYWYPSKNYPYEIDFEGHLEYRPYIDDVSLTSKDGKKLLVKIPDGISLSISEDISIIGDNAISNNDSQYECSRWDSIKIVHIPKSVKYIGNGAFSGCASLQKVRIPCSVQFLGEGVFANCSSLNDIKLECHIDRIPHSTFLGCAALKKIVLPSTIESIGNCAFSECHSLKEMEMSDGIESIGVHAFEACKSLVDIYLPDSVKRIEEGAFSRCESLQKINLPLALTEISQNLFEGCLSLKMVLIPSSVKNICGNPFSGECEIICKSPYFKVSNGALFTSDMTQLIYCFSHDEVFVIPESVTHIRCNAISSCKSRVIKMTGLASMTTTPLCEEVLYPKNEIAAFGFSSLKIVREIELPNGITRINYMAFQNCESLQKIELPSSVITVDESAFEGCKALRHIVIPSSVISIGADVFKDCEALEEVILPCSIESIGKVFFSYNDNTYSDLIFDGCPNLQRIIIPKGSKAKFEKLLPSYKKWLKEV